MAIAIKVRGLRAVWPAGMAVRVEEEINIADINRAIGIDIGARLTRAETRQKLAHIGAGDKPVAVVVGRAEAACARLPVLKEATDIRAVDAAIAVDISAGKAALPVVEEGLHIGAFDAAIFVVVGSAGGARAALDEPLADDARDRPSPGTAERRGIVDQHPPHIPTKNVWDFVAQGQAFAVERLAGRIDKVHRELNAAGKHERDRVRIVRAADKVCHRDAADGVALGALGR